MAENKVLTATSSVVKALEGLSSDERLRAVEAALNILGETAALKFGGRQQGDDGEDNGNGNGVTPKQYFDNTDPKTKMYQLAVAARYREKYKNAESSTKEELKSVIKSARRNFDDSNYVRDMANARDRGLFNKGTGKGSAILAHRGQNYVDALPDQAAAKKVLGKKKKKKKRKKKKAAKKSKKN